MKRIVWLCCALATMLISGMVCAMPTLTIYTYASFNSSWGPGPELTKLFESNCHCHIKWVGLDDGVTLLNRLRLEKQNTKADLIVGLDTNLMPEAEKLGLVQPHQINTSMVRLPSHWHNADFVPFDRGQFAFIYNRNKLKNPPTSLHQLVNSFKGTIIYEDPRTSTPGLGLLLWVKSVYGDKAADAWAKLKPKTVTVTKSWGDAYGMFLKGESDMVLSYTTSPAYHEIVEHKQQYRAAFFKEGHYQQVEVAGISAYAKHPKLARAFLNFLLTPKAQYIIAMNNWMSPVIEGVKLPHAFQQIIHPKVLSISPSVVAKHRQAWIREWRSAVSH